jgi:hypothetical protein
MLNDLEHLTYTERREALKANLRKYAMRFDMSNWFTGKLAIKFVQNEYIGMDDFEACGSACCIAGMGMAMTRERRIGGVTDFFSINEDCFYPSDWPCYLQERYLDAKENHDYDAMVEAACVAIDYFADKY